MRMQFTTVFMHTDPAQGCARSAKNLDFILMFTKSSKHPKAKKFENIIAIQFEYVLGSRRYKRFSLPKQFQQMRFNAAERSLLEFANLQTHSLLMGKRFFVCVCMCVCVHSGTNIFLENASSITKFRGPD